MRERNLWLRLDLSPANGGLARPATDALLHAAAARKRADLHPDGYWGNSCREARERSALR
jgi:hypothetical protein